MNHSTPHSSAEVARQAAEWTARQDRGLSPEEQDALSQWLAEHPQHRDAFAEHRWGWEELDRLAGLQTSLGAVPDPDLLATPRRARGRFRWVSIGALAAAAVISFSLHVLSPSITPATVAPLELLALCEQRTLDDGSVIELNRGASIAVQFTTTERKVRLERGEAFFTVAHEDARPFTVEVAGVAVRAVGTAFTVTLENNTVAVLVTEGQVRVDQPESATSAPEASPRPLLVAGQRSIIGLRDVSLSPQVANVSAAEIAERLAWKPRLLDFDGARLADIAAEFNRHNPVRLVLGHEELTNRKLSATFRSDNVEGFVRLMESDFGMRAERRPGGEIILQLAK